MSKTTQAEAILRHLREHSEGITPLEALNEYGCFRLSARIYDLRQDGHQISEETATTPTGKHVARYRLIGIAPTPRPAPAPTKLQVWVCGQCGADAAYLAEGVGGDKYAIGKCATHGRGTIMTIYRDVV